MEKVKSFFRNLSFRKSFILYVVVALFAAYLASGFTSSYFRSMVFIMECSKQEEITVMTEEGPATLLRETSVNTPEEQQKIAILNAIGFWCVPVYVGIAVVIAAILFYRKKMKKPLVVLIRASDRISESDLDFTLDYSGRDEMGKLCDAFEKMRGALAQNNDLMWRQMEQRKQLNAVFAHDLRTPLTVLKGYAEILQHAGDPKTKDTAVTMTKQINRLERYADSMSSMQKLEDTEPEYKLTDLYSVSHSIEQMAILMCEKANKELDFHNIMPELSVFMDRDMIMQVAENLISNAVRYAKERIRISIMKSNDIIAITVCDDGNGFSEESLRRGTEPYYRADESRADHFGLGLYICKILCKQHGGGLEVCNNGGAQVTASFRTITVSQMA